MLINSIWMAVILSSQPCTHLLHVLLNKDNHNKTKSPDSIIRQKNIAITYPYITPTANSEMFREINLKTPCWGIVFVLSPSHCPYIHSHGSCIHISSFLLVRLTCSHGRTMIACPFANVLHQLAIDWAWFANQTFASRKYCLYRHIGGQRHDAW